MPSTACTTVIDVWLAINSTSMLWWVGSRCWTRTKAMLVGAGRASTSFLQASRPPADAPMATTRNAPGGLSTSRTGNDTLALAAGCTAAGLYREVSDITLGSKGASDRRLQ